MHFHIVFTTMATGQKERSSLGVYEDTKKRFNQAKPYSSMSADEFVSVLLDRWEGKR